MKLHLLVAALVFSLAAAAPAQRDGFPGLEKAMSPQQYEQAGLEKLSAEERAALDRFIRGYVSATAEQAATAAVEEAVKENKVSRNEPEVIQSAIVGTFRGYDGRSMFRLENGQVWRQSQQVSRAYRAIENPPVLIVRKPGALSGYRMYVAGGGDIRVSRVK
jgi:hypothetical protein